MQRREFISVLCGILALRAARAQDRIRRVGILMNFAADDAVAQARHSKTARSGSPSNRETRLTSRMVCAQLAQRGGVTVLHGTF